MKIAIINLTGGGMSGGYRRYLENTIPRLVSHSSIESLLCVSPRSLDVEKWFKPLKNVEFVDATPFELLMGNAGRKLRHKLKQFAPDIIFVPVARCFSFANVPVVNMVQNVFPFLRKSVRDLNFSEALRLYVQYFEAKRASINAEQVIVNLNYVKNLLKEKNNIPEKKISVIPFGVNPVSVNPVNPNIISLDLNNKFIFTAGSIEPYRGLEDIIEAFKYIKRDRKSVV